MRLRSHPAIYQGRCVTECTEICVIVPLRHERSACLSRCQNCSLFASYPVTSIWDKSWDSDNSTAPDELWNVFGVVAHVGVHQEDKLPLTLFQSVHVCWSQTHLTWPRYYFQLLSTEDFLKSLCHRESAIWRIVLHDYHFICKRTEQKCEELNYCYLINWLLLKHFIDHWYHQRQIFTFIVCW